MYLKLTNESEVRLLRQINSLLGKKKLPMVYWEQQGES